MRRAWQRGDGGFTLVEVAVTTAIAGITVASVVAFLAHRQDRVLSRERGLHAARAARLLHQRLAADLDLAFSAERGPGRDGQPWLVLTLLPAVGEDGQLGALREVSYGTDPGRPGTLVRRERVSDGRTERRVVATDVAALDWSDATPDGSAPAKAIEVRLRMRSKVGDVVAEHESVAIHWLGGTR